MLPLNDDVTVSGSGHKHAQTMHIIISGKEYRNVYLRTDFGAFSMKSKLFMDGTSRTNPFYMYGDCLVLLCKTSFINILKTSDRHQ